MSNELKPCAHCGNDITAFCDDLYKVNPSGHDHWVYLRCCKCGAMAQGHGNSKEAAELNAMKNWNTRYKRTCKLIMHDCSPACSECLAEQDYDARFCDQCGAEVADG